MKPKRPRVVINVVLFNRVSYATVWHQIIIVNYYEWPGSFQGCKNRYKMRSEYTVSEYHHSLYFISNCPLENPSYLQTLIICLNKWGFRSRKVRKKCCLYKRLCHLPSCRASCQLHQNFLVNRSCYSHVFLFKRKKV